MTASESSESSIRCDPSLRDLLGSSKALPAWLDAERFLQPDFEPELAVLDLRRFVPLATLHSDLNDYLSLLKAKLVEVINEDYGDYVSLSSRLVNVEGFVLRMRKPLTELKEKLGIIQDSVKAELFALNQGLKRRKEVATARTLLELLQELAHVASKVEKLLAEVSAMDRSGATIDLDSHSRLLERVAGEVSRLSFQSNRGKDLAFVRAMESRTEAYRSDLETRLSSALEAALQVRNTSAALACLHGYVELGEAAPAEVALRRIVVAPVVSRLVSEHKKRHTRPAAAAGHEGDALSSLLSAVLAALQPECGALIHASLATQGTLRIFDFLGNAVLDEVQNVLAAELPAIFSPGVPAAFHANFLAAMRFLSDLEAMCQGRTALDRLRGSSAYSTFLKRWNLSVYFSLLYQEIAGELEESMGMTKLEVVEPAHPIGLQLPVSATLSRCLSRATSPLVFLPQLSDRFLRLLLQLVQRYSSWMTLALASRAADPRQQQQLAPSTAASPTAEVSSEVDAASSLKPPTGGPTWVAQLPVEDLAVLLRDLQLVSDIVGGSVRDAVSKLLSSLPDEAVAGSALQALSSTASGLKRQAEGVLEVMTAELAEKCVNVVKQLKGITATYRMTTKGPPTRHSHYVTGALAPLKAALDSEHVGRLPSSETERIKSTVADIVNVRYYQLADELLKTVRKTEESLKRLKKANADATGEGMSDSDKIGLQLHLDVQEYGNQLSQQFGLCPSEMESYQRLVEVVNPQKGKQS